MQRHDFLFRILVAAAEEEIRIEEAMFRQCEVLWELVHSAAVPEAVEAGGGDVVMDNAAAIAATFRRAFVEFFIDVQWPRAARYVERVWCFFRLPFFRLESMNIVTSSGFNEDTLNLFRLLPSSSTIAGSQVTLVPFSSKYFSMLIIRRRFCFRSLALMLLFFSLSCSSKRVSEGASTRDEPILEVGG